MNIRKAHINDLEPINAIYNQAVGKRFSTAHLEPVPFEERMHWFFAHTPDRYPVYVLEDYGRIKGWISLSAYRPDRQALAHVAEVSYYVEEASQGMGIGSRMMAHAVKSAPDYGFSVLIAILLSHNPHSIALLEKFGFEEWGRMPGIAIIDDTASDHLYYGLHV
jgi:phosphinothricin acetyltransferase